jgi:hypothetical protein
LTHPIDIRNSSLSITVTDTRELRKGRTRRENLWDAGLPGMLLGGSHKDLMTVMRKCQLRKTHLRKNEGKIMGLMTLMVVRMCQNESQIDSRRTLNFLKISVVTTWR